MTTTATAPAATTRSTSLLPHLKGYLRYPTPKILLGYLSVAIVARVLQHRGLTWVDGAVAAGIIAFEPFTEWLIHVFVLHLKPRRIFGRDWELAELGERIHGSSRRSGWTGVGRFGCAAHGRLPVAAGGDQREHAVGPVVRHAVDLPPRARRRPSGMSPTIRTADEGAWGGRPIDAGRGRPALV
jgi:hypothetical protein